MIKAAEGGHAQVVRLLMADPRVDPSAQEDFALVRAAENGYEDIVRMFLSGKLCQFGNGAASLL